MPEMTWRPSCHLMPSCESDRRIPFRPSCPPHPRLPTYRRTRRGLDFAYPMYSCIHPCPSSGPSEPNQGVPYVGRHICNEKAMTFLFTQCKRPFFRRTVRQHCSHFDFSGLKRDGGPHPSDLKVRDPSLPLASQRVPSNYSITGTFMVRLHDIFYLI